MRGGIILSKIHSNRNNRTNKPTNKANKNLRSRVGMIKRQSGKSALIINSPKIGINTNTILKNKERIAKQSEIYKSIYDSEEKELQKAIVMMENMN